MTQLDTLRAAFDRGERLTVASALAQYGIYALSQRCGELARDGYPLESQSIPLPSRKRVKEYYRAKVQTEPVICRAVSANAGASAPYAPGTHSDAPRC